MSVSRLACRASRTGIVWHMISQFLGIGQGEEITRQIPASSHDFEVKPMVADHGKTILLETLADLGGKTPLLGGERQNGERLQRHVENCAVCG